MQFLDNWVLYNILKLKGNRIACGISTQLNSTQLVQFTHGLYGRSKPGIINEIQKKISQSCFSWKRQKQRNYWVFESLELSTISWRGGFTWITKLIIGETVARKHNRRLRRIRILRNNKKGLINLKNIHRNMIY